MSKTTNAGWNSTVACAVLFIANWASAEERQPVRFNQDIRPIMSDTCFKCHGPAMREANLRLDLRDEALQPSDSGATPIVPGKPDESEIIRRIFATDESELMPPPSAHKTLTAEQKELFRRWVEEGAVYQKHWSFEPIVRSPIPLIPDPGYSVLNPIDAFIADRLRREGLPMSSEADKPTLIRRAALALTGLPPVPEAVEQFLADDSPNAYAKMVDRYLASPAFGEEMARHWLDVARYADTHGLHLDNERQMWAYRDWVVRSFNQNLPFDAFTIQQLAGDLIPNATLDQTVATGFIRCNVTTGEGGSIEEEWVFRNAVDRASTAIEAWLGLTGGCAVCHDHKFDPLTAKEFYSLYAFFYSAADPALDGNVLLTQPTLKLMTPEQQQRLTEFNNQLQAKQQQLEAAAAALAYHDPADAQPPAPAETMEQIWFEDEFPAGGRSFPSPGEPTQFVTADQGQVFSGTRALKRSDKGLAQDVYEGGGPFAIPADGHLFAYVWMDPQNPPKSIMLQYFKGGWLHRAVWGDYEAIPWGRANSTERVHMGDLPTANEWIRLEVPADRLGLNSGDQVTGFAFTQFGGTVFWDKAGVSGRSDPAADPRRSFKAWWKQQTGKDTPGVPADVAQVLKDGPDKKPAAEPEKKLRDYYLAAVCLDTKPQLEPLRNELTAIQKQRDDFDGSIPSSFIFKDLPQPRESFVMLRGQYNKPGEKVEPNTPAFLPPLVKADAAARANRLDLAQWIVAPENPLAARVAVNRFWQQIFGTGIVKTSFDLGSQGEPPSHPELLDWLALYFQEQHWDVKDLVRLMVMSASFRQSSQASPDLWQRDPANRLYARGPRVRLDAEQVRDSALCVSGLMVSQMGGKGVKPYQPANIWEPVGFVGSNTRDYVQDHGAALYRRSIYTFLKRTAPPPFMANFDAPSREAFCTRRDRSNTPLQALQLMNDVQYFEAARALAERILREGGATKEERLAFAYRVVLSRAPSNEELALVGATFDQYLARYEQHGEAAEQAIRNGESLPLPGVAAPELAAYTLVANLLLNLDETITRN